MSKWINDIDIEVKDSFETKDKLKTLDYISSIGIITITKLNIKFDKRKTTKEEILKLSKGKEIINEII